MEKPNLSQPTPGIPNRLWDLTKESAKVDEWGRHIDQVPSPTFSRRMGNYTEAQYLSSKQMIPPDDVVKRHSPYRKRQPCWKNPFRHVLKNQNLHKALHADYEEQHPPRTFLGSLFGGLVPAEQPQQYSEVTRNCETSQQESIYFTEELIID